MLQYDERVAHYDTTRDHRLGLAEEKAAFAYEQLKQPVIVIDGAFHIKALDDFPKTTVKFTEKYLGAKAF